MDIEQAIQTIRRLETSMGEIDNVLSSLNRIVNTREKQFLVTLKSIAFGHVDLVLSGQAYADLLRESRARYSAELERLRPIISAANAALNFCGDDWGDRRDAWIETARAALAKAEGKS